MAKANFINYLMCAGAYVIGALFGFWNTILTYQYVSEGTASGINKLVALLVAVSVLIIEQLVFNWMFEPDKAIRLFVPTRISAPPPNPDPDDRIISFYYTVQTLFYHAAKLGLPILLIMGVAAIYYWDFLSTFNALDYANELSRYVVALACVLGTELLWRVAQEHWKWARLTGDPNLGNAVRGMRGKAPYQPTTATPPKSRQAQPQQPRQVNPDDFLPKP